MATGAARRSESCPTVKVTAALVARWQKKHLNLCGDKSSFRIQSHGLLFWHIQCHATANSFCRSPHHCCRHVDQWGDFSLFTPTRMLYIRAPALYSNSPDLASNRFAPEAFILSSSTLTTLPASSSSHPSGCLFLFGRIAKTHWSRVIRCWLE